MFNLYLVAYKNIQRGENIQPLRNSSAKQAEMGYILVQLNHTSEWMGAGVTNQCFTRKFNSENCRLFILGSTFLRDYFQESWVSTNNYRYKYLFVGHSIFATLFTCSPQAQKFIYVWLRLAFHGEQIPTLPQVFSVVTTALTFSSVKTRLYGSKEFKDEGLIISLQLKDLTSH